MRAQIKSLQAAGGSVQARLETHDAQLPSLCAQLSDLSSAAAGAASAGAAGPVSGATTVTAARPEGALASRCLVFSAQIKSLQAAWGSMQERLEAHEAQLQSRRRPLDDPSVTEAARAAVDARLVKFETALSETAGLRARQVHHGRDLGSLMKGHHDLAGSLTECRDWIDDWADQIASVPHDVDRLEDRIAALETTVLDAGLGELEEGHSLDGADSHVNSAASTASTVPRARGWRGQGSSGSGSGPSRRKGKNRGGQGDKHEATGPGPPHDPHAERIADVSGSGALSALQATLAPEAVWQNFPDRW